MKLLLTIFFCLFSILDAALIYPPELEESAAVVQLIPAAKNLIEGMDDTEVLFVDLPNCPWRALLDDGKIIINRSKQINSTSITTSLLFELHNRARAEEIATYYQLAKDNQVSIDQFVESIERIEHRNVLETASAINDAIQKGLLPEDTIWPVVYEFKTHYEMAQLSGHARWLSERYQEVNGSGIFIGTIDDIDSLSEEERRLLAYYLGARDNMLFNEKTKGRFKARIDREYETAKPESKKAKLLERVFSSTSSLSLD